MSSVIDDITKDLCTWQAVVLQSLPSEKEMDKNKYGPGTIFIIPEEDSYKEYAYIDNSFEPLGLTSDLKENNTEVLGPLVENKCPNCGAPLINTKYRTYKCEYCDSVFER
jgi:hypothetical protein